MKRSILAARTEQAIKRIAVETARLGGEFVDPHVRGDVEHQQLARLEAIASALVAIDSSPAQVERPHEELTAVPPSKSKATKATRSQ